MSFFLPGGWPTLDVEHIASSTPVEQLAWPDIEALGLKVYIKREDLLHPFLSGNKFYKLHGYWRDFKESAKTGLASFGGAYSNHLYALAFLGHELGLPTMAIVRGEQQEQLSPTLHDAQALGMQLHFVSRAQYKLRADQAWLAQLQRKFEDYYFIPEGGSGPLGAEGCRLWAKATLAQCPEPPDRICIAAGTGCTAAGIAAAACQVQGDVIPTQVFLALRGRTEEHLQMGQEICEMSQQLMHSAADKSMLLPSISLETNYHCGGYAKFPSYLRNFVERFEAQTGVQLDPVYTAKIFWGIWQMAQQRLLPSDSCLLVFHSGGLQGRRGFELDSSPSEKDS